MNSSPRSPISAVTEESSGELRSNNTSIPLTPLPRESYSLVVTTQRNPSIEGGDPELRIDNASLDHKEKIAQFYKSLPLPQNTKSIRLLTIEAASASDDSSPIIGTLHVVNLETQPVFSALSYVWGENQTPKAIFCGDLALELTENGHDALQHLRAKLGKFTIWIDAICINQQDDTEKGHQIPFMGDIYSRAESAYMWLGKGNEKTDNAMAFLAKGGLLDHFNMDSVAKGWTFRPRLWVAISSLYTSSQDRFANKESLLRKCFLFPRRYQDMYIDSDHIVELLNRGWVRRIWTYQEIIMSSHPILVCGHRHLQWSRLVHSLVFLDVTVNRRDDTLYKSILCTWTKLVCNKIHFNTSDEILDDSSLNTTESVQLEHYTSFIHCHVRNLEYFRFGSFALVSFAFILIVIISLVRNWGTLSWGIILEIITVICGEAILMYFTAPHWPQRTSTGVVMHGGLVDIILGRHATDLKDKAYGILPVLQRVIEMPLPDPDYSLHIGQVYKNLCAYILTSTKSLDLLLPAAIHGFPGQPSWVPDWSKDYMKEWIQPEMQKLSENSEISSWNSENSNGLVVSIKHVGTVLSCYTFLNTYGLHVQTQWNILLEDLRTIRKFIATFKSRRSLCFLMTTMPTKFSEINYSALALSLTRFYWQYRTNPPSDETRGILHELVTKKTLWRVLSSFFLYTQILFCSYLARNKLVLFRAEGISSLCSIGVCTNNVQPGDKVVFIHGGNSLFIVRGEPHSAKLISPAIIELDGDPEPRPGDRCKIKSVSQLIESGYLGTEQYTLT